MTLELSPPMTAPFRLGDWWIAPDRNEIRRDGRAVRLEPLSMRLLCLLADNAGRTVSRGEIVTRLWDGRAVTDDAVGRQIAKLREAFGDDARRPVVIQTVPKVGVLLLPPVQPGSSVRPAPSLPPDLLVPPDARPEQTAPRRKLLVGAGVAAGLAVAAVMAAGVLAPQRATGAGDATETPVTALVGVEQDPALSPNGAMLAYVSDAEPQGFGLYGRRLAEDDAVRLTSPGSDGCKPAWSPEGDRIAFVRHVHGGPGCEIVVVSPVSGQVRVIAPCRDARQGGLAWVGSEGLVFADRGEVGSRTLRLYRVPVEGGRPVPLTAPPAGSSGDSRPVHMPDERAVYFLRDVGGDVSEIFRLDLTTGKVAQVTRERSTLLGLSSGGKGRLLVSATNRADLPPAIWSLDLRQQRWTRRVTGGEYWNLTSSADGRSVVFERARAKFSLASLDPATGQSHGLTQSNQREHLPTVSPRGDRLAFISSRSGAPQVWLAQADGARAKQLTFLERGRPGDLTWAPDGRSIVLSLGSGGQYDLVRVDIPSGATSPLTRTAGDEKHPVFGLDGSLYFTRKDGAEHRLIRRDPTTNKESLAALGVVRAVPAEGAGFYVTRPEQEGVWRLSQGVAPVRVAAFPALAPARNWTYREGAVWAVTQDALVRTDPSTGATRRLALPDSAFGMSGLDVRDGKVIYARRDDFDIDLYRLGL